MELRYSGTVTKEKQTSLPSSPTPPQQKQMSSQECSFYYFQITKFIFQLSISIITEDGNKDRYKVSTLYKTAHKMCDVNQF